MRKALFVLLSVCAILALDLFVWTAHGADLHYQCGDYVNGKAVFANCGPAVKLPVQNVPAESDHQPPRFLPAVALYRDNRFIGIQVGTTFSYTCRAALDDTKSTLAKAIPAGAQVVGLCIPIPTYSVLDLTPSADVEKPAVDNTL